MSSRTSSKVTSRKVSDLYDACILKNYGPVPMTLVRGEGSYVWDAEGRRYLDFVSGIAVNTIGHCHPEWTRRICEQAGKLAHVSNLFGISQQAELASRLCEKAGAGRLFFCNSGAEANEFLIKLARLWGREKSGGQEGSCFRIISAHNAFHGRTFGGMAATPQTKIQGGFAPMLDGFLHAEFNNAESFRQLVDDSVCAILLETIQGEGGVHPASESFLRDIRNLCNEKGLLLLIDEVQCGIGRSGKFFAFEHAGIEADAIGMAKGLGGGFPIGAGWVREPFKDLFKPGSHGTTYGGNPLACTAALAVLDVIEQEDLLQKVTERSRQWHASLTQLVEKHPQHLSALRGVGYHVALAVSADPLEWVSKLRDNGLLVVRGGSDGIRLMPPLNVSTQDLETSVEILDFVFGTTK